MIIVIEGKIVNTEEVPVLIRLEDPKEFDEFTTRMGRISSDTDMAAIIISPADMSEEDATLSIMGRTERYPSDITEEDSDLLDSILEDTGDGVLGTSIEKYTALFDLAEKYHKLCGRYNKRICGGEPEPRNKKEEAKVIKHTKDVRRRLLRKAEKLGIDEDAFQHALDEYAVYMPGYGPSAFSADDIINALVELRRG